MSGAGRPWAAQLSRCASSMRAINQRRPAAAPANQDTAPEPGGGVNGTAGISCKTSDAPQVGAATR